jgi:serine/threonine-protein kinase haspin
VAEDSLAFEHRDLHWGNVMLRPAAASHVTARLRGSTLRAATHGAEVTLIDFTASRLQTPGGDVAFCDLEAEEGLFDGPKGKPQFETYRCVMHAGFTARLFLPLQRGAGPMALMLWLDWVIII